MDVRAEKAKLRRQLREALSAVPPDHWREASALACQRLASRPEWRKARSIFLYAAMPGELDFWPLAITALRAGCRVAFPRYDPERDEYRVAAINQRADLRPGHRGILEPGPNCPELPLNQLDLALVPGLGFDPGGRRLGRGRGYYDRLLGGMTGVSCGVGLDVQVVPFVPVEPHDRLLDCILTPTRWVACNQRAV